MSTVLTHNDGPVSDRSQWLAGGLLAMAVLLLGAVAAASGSSLDLLAVTPFALIALALATRLYFGVETIVRLVERLRRPRPRPEAVQAPTGLSSHLQPALLLLAGTRASRAPPACAPALS